MGFARRIPIADAGHAAEIRSYNRVVPRAVEQLEAEFAAWLDARGAVAAGFGRAALRLALEALEVRGGQVLVPDFVCEQVPEAVRRAGAEAVFYAVRRDLSVAAEDFEAAFTPHTRAAIIVHYFGRVFPDAARFAAVCRRRGVPLVEDCALALGASLGGQSAGTFGDLAAFSFTKSDWCYGGGMVAAARPDLLLKLRALRDMHFREYRSLAWRYGLLRRLDFAANRPELARVAETAGRWFERLSGGEGNFYDAGRFDAALPAFAARRAQRVLRDLASRTSRCRQILHRLAEALRDSPHILFHSDQDPGDAASFLLLRCPSSCAPAWVEQAAREGVTLRFCWTAYQESSGAAASGVDCWLRDHLLLLEIHPGLRDAEMERIVRAIRGLPPG